MPGANGPSARTREKMPGLLPKFKRFFERIAAVYGSPRIHAALQARGIRCGRKRVVRLMQTLGLQAKRRRQSKPTTTRSDPTARFAPNMLNPDLTSLPPNTSRSAD